MGKDPAVLLYTSDFLTGTMTMTNEQVGMYIRLLCLQHQKGVLSDNDMLFICKSHDKDVYNKFTKNGDGYYNKRMRLEIEKRQKWTDSRRDNRLGKLKKDNKIKKKTSNKHMKNTSKTYDQHMENENENTNDNIIEVYEHYCLLVMPLRKSRQRSLINIKHWKKKHSTDELKICADNYFLISQHSQPKYRKDPANFYGQQEPTFKDYLPDIFKPPEETEGKYSQITAKNIQSFNNWEPPE